MKPSDTELTAYHEAGHAVAATAWVGHVHVVSIRPDHAVGSGGRCGVVHRDPQALAAELARGAAHAERHRETLLGYVRFCFAGGLAEQMRDGHGGTDGAKDDIDEAVRWIEVTDPGDFDGAMMREMTLARSFLVGHWDHVVAVVNALARHETLDRPKFLAAIEPHGPTRPLWIPPRSASITG